MKTPALDRKKKGFGDSWTHVNFILFQCVTLVNIHSPSWPQFLLSSGTWEKDERICELPLESSMLKPSIDQSLFLKYFLKVCSNMF
jgi:hypothetical protein